MMKIAWMIAYIIMISTGCINAGNAEDTARHDIAGLEKLVNLEPIKIDTSYATSWKVYPKGIADSRVPGPIDYYLVAAIKVQPLDMTKFTEIETMHIALEKRSDYYPAWMPESIKNYNAVAMGKKPKIYDVSPFVESSYRNGFFFITDDNYLYIILGTQ